jgi:hypothetical protein
MWSIGTDKSVPLLQNPLRQDSSDAASLVFASVPGPQRRGTGGTLGGALRIYFAGSTNAPYTAAWVR